MKKQKENSLENITWSEMGKQNVQAKEVYYMAVVLSSGITHGPYSNFRRRLAYVLRPIWSSFGIHSLILQKCVNGGRFGSSFSPLCEISSFNLITLCDFAG